MDSSEDRKKGKFFYDCVVLQVDDTLHRIPRYHLETWSEMFKDMFQLPQGSESEGSSEKNPIVLPGCTNAEFESLLTVLFTPASFSPLSLSQDQWMSVLKLATIWDMAPVRKLSVEKLSSLDITPLQKVQLGRAYKVASWLIDGCAALIEDPEVKSLDSLASYLGWETAGRLAWAARKNPIQNQGKVLIGTEKWECVNCATPGSVTAEAVSSPPFGASAASSPFGTFSAPQSAFGTTSHSAFGAFGSTPSSTPQVVLATCSACRVSSRAIEVDFSNLDIRSASQPGTNHRTSGLNVDSPIVKAVKEVFAEELKDMY